MSKWHEFLLEHAKFPFPQLNKHPNIPFHQLDEDTSVGTANMISQIEVGLLRPEWKANHAVRDDALVQKLSLKDILGETVLPAGSESYLLQYFSPELGHQDNHWLTNPSEAHVSFQNDSRS